MEQRSNFDFLKHHDELLLKLAETAEACFVPAPNATLVKMRQLGEELAKSVASRVGVDSTRDIDQVDLIKKLNFTLQLDPQIKEAFDNLRWLGNPAVHDITSNSHKDALKSLRVGHTVAGWFHEEFGGDAAKGFRRGAFIPPRDPSEKVRQLEEYLKDNQRKAKSAEQRLEQAEKLKQLEVEKAKAEKQRAEEMATESQVWEQLATEYEAKVAQLQAQIDATNQKHVEHFNTLQDSEKAQRIRKVENSTLHLSEADTRVIIDQQLIDAGWEADTQNLRYGKGARPQANVNRAIAEWPTASGPADYVLFMGLTPVATLEAKKGLKNVRDDISQAKRYARDFDAKGVCDIKTQYGAYQVPLTFATNGRPYLEQIEEHSGIWFLDVRDSTNARRALKGWFTPDEIKTYLRQTPKQAESELEQMGFDYQLKLRDYQINAIRAVETAIKSDKKSALIAMATGTGKTKTAIALLYRLLKAERFRRILFLVDRSALGVQASNDFADVRLENLVTFADTFDVLGMEKNKSPKAKPDKDTKVHVTTVQGLVKRILYSKDKSEKPGVGQYDCIIIDECHRGYLLDKELSDTELLFRDQDDYQSKYRQVIDYFDAFKIGLTATPALHTTDIFGKPVFSYSYTEAVIDGYLNDHLPPVRIHTQLTDEGIKYQVNEPVKVYNVEDNSIETYNTPDELSFEVADFNRRIMAPEYTKAVAKWLVESDAIDPWSKAKTLVFCVNNDHADRVVQALRQAVEDYHGTVDDDAIQKITGSVDKPLDRITHFKNDTYPNIAVTVDLLTTGVDVPSICNLVFLRRVNSRILFEQMLGRATRLCPEIGKGPFHIYDAVDIYTQLEKVSTMKPVVTKVDISFTELEQEITRSSSADLQSLARDQFIAKLQVKKNFLTPEQADKFKTVTGMTAGELAKNLKTMPLKQAIDWLSQHPGLGGILDEKVQSGGGSKPGMVFHDGDDKITRITTGYGEGQKPEDYLTAFTDFVNANSNRLQAIQIVVNSPWSLTRQGLKELALELEQNQFREKDLQTAWCEVKQEDIAARIIGFIRQAALGEPLIPWEQRVDKALDKLLNSRPWKTPQKQWLALIAKQVKATTIVDQAALDQGVFKSQGGSKRGNKLFDKPVVEILEEFNQALWA